MAVTWQMVLDAIIYIVHIVVDRLLEFVLGYIHGPRKSCPPPASKAQEQIITRSATELAQLIKEQKLTSREVVKAYIERIQAVNPTVNAVVDGPFVEEALKEAAEIDERLANNAFTANELASKPFLGVPFTTKDSTAVAGKLQTLGLISRKNEKAKEDAECVRLMKESGAIIIATSNIPEVNMWIESRNLLIGSTNNPYDLRRSVGGSSGGEGALITSCCTAFGLGTDIGGSIRIPSFDCGIFGHKPTKNIVNLRGCTFRTGKELQTMCAAGPMTRFAQDLKPILKVIAGSNADALKLDEKVDLKKLRYFYIPSNNMKACTPVNQAAENVMLKVRSHFAELTGRPVELAKLPNLEISGKLWHYWMTQEPADIRVLMGNGVALNPIVELVKKLTGQSNFTMAAIYSLINRILPKGDEKFLRDATLKCKEALKDLLGDDGVLIYQSQPRTTPFHYYPLLKFADYHYFSIFNVLHVPATQVPMGLDSNGLPLGIQVVSTEMNDRYCLAVAEELQNSIGGWTAPFKTNS